jgi:hypothetical protein
MSLDSSALGASAQGWLVGTVGIENNTDRNFKDLEEMLGER